MDEFSIGAFCAELLTPQDDYDEYDEEDEVYFDMTPVDEYGEMYWDS